MQHRQRPVAWPLALSLAAHIVLVLLWWRQAPVPAAPTTTAQRAPMVWLRLALAPGAQLAPVAATAVAAAPARPRQAARAAAKPLPAPTKVDTPIATAEPMPAAAPAVTGVAFGPPRWSLPFGGASAGAVFGTRKLPAAAPTAAPPIAAAAVTPEPPRALREQVLQALEAQIAGWSAPVDPQPAQCRLATEPTSQGNPEPECDSVALARALAERLPTLRDTLAALRRAGPDATRGGVNASESAALVIAFADGRYRLQLSAH